MKKIMIFSFLLALVFFGCKSLDLFDEPTVILNKDEPVAYKGLDNNGLNLLAKIDVTNNDSMTIPRTNIDWKLYVMGESEPLTTGSLSKNDSIGKGQTVVLDVPVSISVQQLFQHAPALIGQYISGNRDLPYKIELGISFSVFPLFKISHAFSGTMPLPNPMQLF